MIHYCFYIFLVIEYGIVRLVTRIVTRTLIPVFKWCKLVENDKTEFRIKGQKNSMEWNRIEKSSIE